MNTQISWNLQDLLRGQSPEDLRAGITRGTEEIAAWRNRLDTLTPVQLRKLLDQKDQVKSDLSRYYSYYSLRQAEDTADPGILAKLSELEQFATEISNKLLFLTLWIMHLPDEQAKTYLESEPLAPYHYLLTSIRKDKPYTKTEEIEHILNLKNITSSHLATMYDILSDGFHYELDGKSITKEELISLKTSPRAEIRERIYPLLFQPYQEHKALFSELYKAIVLDWNIEGIRIRNHTNPISIRNHANDIPDEAITTLLSVIRSNARLFADYFTLKHAINTKTGQTTRTRAATSTHRIQDLHRRPTPSRSPSTSSLRRTNASTCACTTQPNASSMRTTSTSIRNPGNEPEHSAQASTTPKHPTSS
ncbi:MAG: M3 family oligoendopeptidase [Nitrosarchaeum sp.]|nr:M3 family oligoendopeptidase [Nitrosarchaeum sp.]